MSDRFLFVYNNLPGAGYDDTRILVIDRGPEPIEGTEYRGDRLRSAKQGVVLAVCDHEESAARIVAALEAAPGDRKVDPYEEPF